MKKHQNTRCIPTRGCIILEVVITFPQPDRRKSKFVLRSAIKGVKQSSIYKSAMLAEY